MAAFLCYGLIVGGLHIEGWIGDRTDQAGQAGIIIGDVFPGGLCFNYHSSVSRGRMEADVENSS